MKTPICLVILLGFGLTACNEPLTPAHPLAGNWSYDSEFPPVDDPDAEPGPVEPTCGMKRVILTFTEDTGPLTGHAFGGAYECFSPAGTLISSEPLFGMQMTNFSYSGGSVGFRLSGSYGASDFTIVNNGTLTGQTLFGEASLQKLGDPEPMAGTFVAVPTGS
jgi:hypothetical protein